MPKAKKRKRSILAPILALLLVLALSIGRRTKPLDLVQVPAEKRRLSRRTAAAAERSRWTARSFTPKAAVSLPTGAP